MFLLPIFLYSEGFDEVTNLDKIPEATLNTSATLERASESDSMCKNNGRVVAAATPMALVSQWAICLKTVPTIWATTGNVPVEVTDACKD